MSFNSKVAKIFLLIFFLKFILLIIRFRSVIKWSILNYFIFLSWEVRVKVVFTRGYLVITASFVEKTMLFHWITFISLSKINWMYWMYMCIYICMDLFVDSILFDLRVCYANTTLSRLLKFCNMSWNQGKFSNFRSFSKLFWLFWIFCISI